MAHPIPLESPPRDARAELLSRLQEAPAEHAEALLAAYEVLQGLHDRGVLDLMRGALGSGDKVVDIVVDAANSPDAIRSIRNLLLLVNMLGAIDPEELAALTRAIPQALKSISEQPEPPGLFRSMKDLFSSHDARRSLSALTTMLETFGKSLADKNGRGRTKS